MSTFEQYFKAINNPEVNFYQPDEDAILFNSRIIDSELQVMFDELNIPISQYQTNEIVKACKDLKKKHTSKRYSTNCLILVTSP